MSQRSQYSPTMVTAPDYVAIIARKVHRSVQIADLKEKNVWGTLRYIQPLLSGNRPHPFWPFDVDIQPVTGQPPETK